MALLTVLCPSTVGADCPGCGSVAGSVTVEQAFVRADGPKHDLDVVVMLEPEEADAPPPATGTATMDQTGLVFVPHVLAVQRGTTVTFLNTDREQHNVYFLDDRSGETLDIGTWGPGVSVDHTFDTAGTMITLCKLHLEMAAYLVVTPGPWFDAVELDPDNSSGRFTIDNVSPGRYRLTAWHKKLKQQGGPATVEVAGAGRFEVNVVITKTKYARASD